MKNIINGIKINQLLHLTLLLGAFCSINLFSMRMTEKGMAAGKAYWAQQTLLEKQTLLEREEAISRKRGLLIFLDEQERGDFEAIGQSLLTALYQEAGPIIVSTSLLCTLRDYWQKDVRPVNVLLEEGSKIENSNEKFLFSKTVLSRVCFREDRWIIKKINNSLHLLIPVIHLQLLNIVEDKVEEFDSSMGINELSDVELKLGLKINHMETVEFTSIKISPFVSNASYFTDFLNHIFVKKNDYINKKMDIVEWSIFIEGHGSINKYIAYLTLDDFKKLLNFLEKEIITQLLVVFSCYAAGVNANKIYGELKLGTQQYYSFPIIIQGLNDIGTVDNPISIDWTTWKFSRSLYVNTKINFADFLEKVKTVEGNYNEVMKPFKSYSLRNIPQIKLPGIEWFSLMGVNKKVVSINSIFAKTRDPQKPLDLTKQKPHAILLYTDNIPFELKIDISNLGQGGIFSMVSSGPMKDKPDFVIHRIKKLVVGKRDHHFITNKIVIEGPHKWFFIDEVDDGEIIYKNVLLFSAEKERESLTSREPVKCYYEDKNNILFTDESWKKEEKSGWWDRWDYASKMRVVRKYFELQEKQEVGSEYIKKMEELQQSKIEDQKVLKALKETYTASEL